MNSHPFIQFLMKNRVFGREKGYLSRLSNIRIMVQNLLSHSKVLHAARIGKYKNSRRNSGCFIPERCVKMEMDYKAF